MWKVSRGANPSRVRRLFCHQSSSGVWSVWPGGVRPPDAARPELASQEGLGEEVALTSSPNICAPMTSRVVLIGVQVGENVEAGALVAVVEAMKMEYPLVSQRAGRVASIHHQAQDRVQRGDVLVTITPAPSSGTIDLGAQR